MTDDRARERDRDEKEKEGLPESLRTAVERTLATTAGSAAGTRERAQELLDEVARRGLEAREEIARRGQEARGELARRVGMVSGEGLRELSDRLSALERRVEGLEQAARSSRAGSQAEPEG